MANSLPTRNDILCTNKLGLFQGAYHIPSISDHGIILADVDLKPWDDYIAVV